MIKPLKRKEIDWKIKVLLWTIGGLGVIIGLNVFFDKYRLQFPIEIYFRSPIVKRCISPLPPQKSTKFDLQPTSNQKTNIDTNSKIPPLKSQIKGHSVELPKRRILPFKKFLTKRNAEVRKYVLKLLKGKYHYAGDELIAMDNIFKKETGYNPTAVNSQGCKGLGQDCLNRMKCKLSYNEKDIECQVDWTIGYVKGRYGNPIIAWIKHLKVNWY